MKKGCALLLGLWLVLTGLYAYVAWPKIQEILPTGMIAVLGGTFATMLVSSAMGLFTGARDRAALRRAMGGAPFEDGRLEAVSGTVRALAAPLEAPFTGRSCVAYEYDVKQHGADQSEFAGMALAPSAIDGPRGTARLLGWAMLDQFPAAPRQTIDRARGKAYLEGATFDRLGIANMLSVLGELIAEDDGSMRKDFRIDAQSIDLEGRAISERVVPVGAEVTVLGRWSASRQGLAPAGTASMNRLFVGDLRRTSAQLRGSSWKTFGTALLFFLALHAILLPMYLLAPAR